MKKNNFHLSDTTVLIIVAVIGLLLLVFFLLFGSALVQGIFALPVESNNTNTNASQIASSTNNGGLELGYDPLITMVPEDLQTLGKNSKVFISDVDPYLGSSQAKAVVVVWSRFDNEQAKESADILKQISNEYGDKIVIIWKDFINPDNNNEIGYSAALAAHCANEQDLFWPYHDLLFDNYDHLDANTISELATTVNLDMNIFNECIDNQSTKAIVESNYYRGLSAGITNAPAVFVNDAMIDDALNIDTLKNAINDKINE
ncbi:MAG: thioredoxin domain-containing protein [Patescibacteria group bacterium]